MGILLIKISVIYLFIGTALGMYMSIVKDFALGSVHTHVSLLGWTTMTLAGIIYHTFPKLEKSILCKIQFVLYNVGLPVMMIGMVLYTMGLEGFIIAVSIGAIVTSIAILLFAIDVLTGLRNVSQK